MAEAAVVYRPNNKRFHFAYGKYIGSLSAAIWSKASVISFDEKQFLTVSNVVKDIPMKPGSSRKQDSEHKREGTGLAF